MKSIWMANKAYLPFIQFLVTVATLSTLLLDFSLNWLLVSLGMYCLIAALGISIGYHRYFTHRTFNLRHSWMKWILMWLGCLAGTGSPIIWAAVHRHHHRYSDKSGDPHSPKNLGLKTFIADYQYIWRPYSVKDLIKDPVHRFVHQYYYLLLTMWLIVAAVINVHLALYGVVIPMTMMVWVSTASSFFTHRFGYVSYDTNDNSRNLWWMALLTFGEGWHNNHHASPRSYTFTRKWWELDIGGIIITYCLKA